VEVTYLRAGRAFSARANGCVLACYNMMIPYLCPELPAGSKRRAAPIGQDPAGLHQRRAAQLAGVRCAQGLQVYAPGSYHTYFA
jgi:spermidine dehydrogenase